jgi:LmbE family N-acetylglucosaminyl deacetylase
MAEIRQREAEAAAASLAVDRFEWLGLPEGEWRGADLHLQLCEVLRRCEPSLVYAPSRVDFHPEHHAIAHGLAGALSACYSGDAGPLIRIYQVQVPLSAVLANRVLDISSVASAHDSALDAHTSQRGSIVSCRRLKRYAARANRLAELAEVFWELEIGDYRELHREDPEIWPERFRGIRYLAVGDPAAYLVGRTARRRLIARLHPMSRNP